MCTVESTPPDFPRTMNQSEKIILTTLERLSLKPIRSIIRLCRCDLFQTQDEDQTLLSDHESFICLLHKLVIFRQQTNNCRSLFLKQRHEETHRGNVGNEDEFGFTLHSAVHFFSSETSPFLRQEYLVVQISKQKITIDLCL